MWWRLLNHVLAPAPRDLNTFDSIGLTYLRPRKPRKARSSCGSIDITVHEDPQSPSSDESSDIETPSKPRALTAQSGTGQSQAINTSQDTKSDLQQQQYCTQACLLGLTRRRPLDGLDQKTLAQLMLCQLALDPDNGCEPLGKQGARGALFRLTLDTYGYTFVAKGTVRAFKAKLKHEGVVYRHLNELQGELIPVYLGNISLACPYFFDVGVRIVHMLLMSWAGEQAQKDLMSSIGRDINEETTRAVTKLRYHGVEHCDVRPPNVLWNSEGENVMLVDLEQSEILKRVPALQETSPNKRRRLHSKEGASCDGASYRLFTDKISYHAQKAS